MIVPMKKVTLIVLDRERKAALVELRKVGVLHPVVGLGQGGDFAALTERKAKADSILNVLRDIASTEGKKAGTKKAQTIGAARGDAVDAAALMDRAGSLLAERRTAEEAIARLRTELARLEGWGPLDPAWFAELAAAGVDLAPYEIPVRIHAALGESVRLLVVSRTKTMVRCLVFREDGRVPASLGDAATPLPLGDRSTFDLEKGLREYETRSVEIGKELTEAAAHLDACERRAAMIAAECEFERLRSGMELLTDESEGHALAHLTGFVPEEDVGRLLAAAKAHGWAVLADDPADDDAVPTKVKNSPLVRLVDPILSFLGTVPSYREYDISAWFLLFFCFFFAMIFGDGGYGSILLLSGLIMAVKAKRARKPVPDTVRLLLVLAGFTIFWGTMTLSWFGIDPAKLPSFLKSIDLDWISNENPDSGENVKTLCFYLGTIQLVIAHLKNIRRDIGSLKFLAQIGQLAMVVGMLSLALNLVINAGRFPIPAYAPYFIAVGFALNFLFANWESGIGFFKGLVKSVMGSMANIVSVFLGVVNVFADIVSYIRLWAVGLAGLAISQTINNMVGPMLGKFSLFLIGAFILVAGHGINILLSVLSVIVHGVRLNMLEFSGHLGMEWSGFSYDPFKERVTTNETSSKEQS